MQCNAVQYLYSNPWTAGRNYQDTLVPHHLDLGVDNFRGCTRSVPLESCLARIGLGWTALDYSNHSCGTGL